MTQKTEGDYLRKKVFQFIVQFKKENDGNSPSIREIGEAVGVDSTSHILYILNRLEERGLIENLKGKSRGLRVVGGKWSYPARE